MYKILSLTSFYTLQRTLFLLPVYRQILARYYKHPYLFL